MQRNCESPGKDFFQYRRFFQVGIKNEGIANALGDLEFWGEDEEGEEQLSQDEEEEEEEGDEEEEEEEMEDD